MTFQVPELWKQIYIYKYKYYSDQSQLVWGNKFLCLNSSVYSVLLICGRHKQFEWAYSIVKGVELLWVTLHFFCWLAQPISVGQLRCGTLLASSNLFQPLSLQTSKYLCGCNTNDTETIYLKVLSSTSWSGKTLKPSFVWEGSSWQGIFPHCFGTCTSPSTKIVLGHAAMAHLFFLAVRGWEDSGGRL